MTKVRLLPNILSCNFLHGTIIQRSARLILVFTNPLFGQTIILYYDSPFDADYHLAHLFFVCRITSSLKKLKYFSFCLKSSVLHVWANDVWANVGIHLDGLTKIGGPLFSRLDYSFESRQLKLFFRIIFADMLLIRSQLKEIICAKQTSVSCSLTIAAIVMLNLNPWYKIPVVSAGSGSMFRFQPMGSLISVGPMGSLVFVQPIRTLVLLRPISLLVSELPQPLVGSEEVQRRILGPLEWIPSLKPILIERFRF